MTFPSQSKGQNWGWTSSSITSNLELSSSFWTKSQFFECLSESFTFPHLIYFKFSLWKTKSSFFTLINFPTFFYTSILFSLSSHQLKKSLCQSIMESSFKSHCFSFCLGFNPSPQWPFLVLQDSQNVWPHILIILFTDTFS